MACRWRCVEKNLTYCRALGGHGLTAPPRHGHLDQGLPQLPHAKAPRPPNQKEFARTQPLHITLRYARTKKNARQFQPDEAAITSRLRTQEMGGISGLAR